MRRELCWWTAGALAIVIASAAGAQLAPTLPPVPAVSPPAVSPIALKKSVTAPVTIPKTSPLTAPSLSTGTIRSVTQDTVAVAPRLNTPLSSVSAPLLNAPLGFASAPLATQTGSAGSATLNTRGATSAHSPRSVFYLNPGLGRLTTLSVPATAAGAQTLLAARARRLDGLIRANPLRLDRDDLGNPVVSGRLLAIDPDAASLKRAERSGFPVTENLNEIDLGLDVVTLGVPKGMSLPDALRRLKAAAPRLDADYDHIFEPAGGSLGASAARLSPSSKSARRLIGMIDGGVADHPALAGRIAAQQGFAGPPRATGHGTAVASLLVGQQGKFRGAANGASLLVADVYGGESAAGSASAISRALGWLAARQPQVINISLVGPANELIRRAVRQVRARGILIVAAVGNDGPAAPPQYPASYADVIAITGVDAGGVALFESGNSAHLDFAAPGADMAAARPGQGYVRVRGTSFASPLAAGRLATLGSLQRLAAETRRGMGRVGRGIVCFTCRVDPVSVAAR